MSHDDTDLTNEQWALIEPLLPPQPARSRKRRYDRQAINAILYLMREGCRWCNQPQDLGDDSTAHRWLLRWQEDGKWERIWLTVLSTLDAQHKLDWAQAILDGSFAPAKKGGSRWEKPVGAKARRSWLWQTALVFLSPSAQRVLRRMK